MISTVVACGLITSGVYVLCWLISLYKTLRLFALDLCFELKRGFILKGGLCHRSNKISSCYSRPSPITHVESLRQVARRCITFGFGPT